MPFQLNYEPEKRYVLIDVIGAPSPAELKQLMVDLTSSDEYPPDVDSVIDFRRIDMSVVHARSENEVNAIRAGFPERGQARLAMVVATDEGFGMARMFALLSEENLPQTMAVFRSVGEAEAWLRNADAGEPNP